MIDFWKKQKKGFLALAPMAGFTDSAFRQVCKGFGADVVYTEMASAAAIYYAGKQKRPGGSETLRLLEFDESERPLVVQLFGSETRHFEAAGRIVSEAIKPDGIDINFGCPVPKVARQNSGAELFKNLKKSRDVIKALLASTSLPVSIKTRVSAGGTGLLKFLKNIEDLGVKALMVHGRTKRQGFSGEIDTKTIGMAKDYFPGVIMANGGINSREAAIKIREKTGADGLGVARGALGRPWIFKAIRTGQEAERSPRAVFKVALEHARLMEKLKGKAGLIEIRKHLCWYVSGLNGAKRLRQKLVKAENIKQISRIFSDF